MSNTQQVVLRSRVPLPMTTIGLILLLTHGWFSQQHTVGLVLVVMGAGPIAAVLLGILILLIAAGIGDLWDMSPIAKRQRRKRLERLREKRRTVLR